MKKRQEQLQLKLHEEFEECSEKELDHKSILQIYFTFILLMSLPLTFSLQLLEVEG